MGGAPAAVAAPGPAAALGGALLLLGVLLRRILGRSILYLSHEKPPSLCSPDVGSESRAGACAPSGPQFRRRTEGRNRAGARGTGRGLTPGLPGRQGHRVRGLERGKAGSGTGHGRPPESACALGRRHPLPPLAPRLVFHVELFSSSGKLCPHTSRSFALQARQRLLLSRLPGEKAASHLRAGAAWVRHRSGPVAPLRSGARRKRGASLAPPG